MALSTLRLLCSDLKTDKKWRQYAGAQVQDVSLSGPACFWEEHCSTSCITSAPPALCPSREV